MKRYNELTDKELSSLSAAQLETLVELELAHEGIPLLGPAPTSPTTALTIERKVTMYEVGGLSALFVSREAATVVANTIQAAIDSGEMRTEDYDYNAGGYDIKFAKEYVYTPTVIEKKLFDPNEVRAHAAALAAQKKAKEAFEKANEEYKKQARAVSAIRNEVYAASNEASERIATNERLKTAFEKYLTLAGGDRTIALRFFDQAHPGIQEHCPEEYSYITGEPMAVAKAQTQETA